LDLSDAIQRLKPKPFEGRVHRIYDPEHGFLETIGNYIVGGRWNRQGRYGALYTSLSKATAVAEIRRGAEKRNRKPSELGRRDHVVMRIRLTRVLNLTQQNFCKSIDISLDELFDNNTLCLDIADEVRKVGCEALRVPSATKSGINLVIYQDSVLPGWVFEEIDREENIILFP